MQKFKAEFIITEAINCPLYHKGESMTLTGKTFSCPMGKEVCLILVRDVTQLLFQLLGQEGELSAESTRVYSCSGCTGLIKFVHHHPDEKGVFKADPVAATSLDAVMKATYGRTVDSPFLRALPLDNLATLLTYFEDVKVEAGTILIHQGEPNFKLYLVMTGKFTVIHQDMVIAELGEGELFGEMSYLGGEVAASSVQAVDGGRVLAISVENFGRLLSNVAAVQLFVARLLAQRLSRLNANRAKDFNACMSGRLDSVVPAELFQVFHMHQKTGVLAMDLAQGKAKVSFREGCIINAGYAGKTHQDAIFDILKEKRGHYRFTSGLTPQEMIAAEIGDFMMLLMEGVKRIDEEYSEDR